MAHGTPDWGVTSGAVTTYQLTDLAELASRLGSPDTFDRRGDVTWWEDFECGFTKWVTNVSGTGSAAALSTARARNGRTSALHTGGSDLSRLAGLTHRQPFAALSNFGLEYSFSLGGSIDRIRIQLQLFDGVNNTTFLAQWDDINNRLQYQDAAGVLQTIATAVDLIADATLFHTWKLVVDAAARQYVRLLVDQRSISLANVAASVIADATAPHVALVTALLSRAGFNDTAYVDDVIFTQNEPA